MGLAMKSFSARSPFTSSLRRLFARNSGRRLFQLEQLSTESRYNNESAIRELCASAYLGEGRSLCRVLGRYKMIVDTADAGLSSHLHLDGYWEMWLTELLNDLVRPGMKVIDVGANLGYFSLLMADLVGPEGSVHAFEPNVDLAHRMSQSVAINGFQDIVKIYQQALSDDESEVLLVIPQNEPKNGHLLPGDHPVSSDHSVDSRRLWTRRLDSYDGLADADLIKIDADTSEHAIWEGMRGILDAGRPLKVVLEFAHARYDDPGAFLDRIQTDGFSIAEITPEHGVQPTTQSKILAAPATSDVMLLLDR